MKNKMFLDFDSTIVDSLKSFTDVYNILYLNYPEFKLADPNKVCQYNLKCQCPLIDRVLDIFEHKLFFENLEFINHNTYDVLERLNEKYQLIIVTIGNYINLSRKALWLEKKLPFIKDCLLISNDGCKMDKSIINMSGSGNIFVDDVSSNLFSSNAETKILFGKRFEWNMNWEGENCLNWSEIKYRFL